MGGMCENCGADVELIEFRSHECHKHLWREVGIHGKYTYLECDCGNKAIRHRPYVGYIVGVDDGGPYEIMGDESEPDETPLAAFHYMFGFWDEFNRTGVKKPHIRIWRGDDYVYAWTPGADVLESMTGGDDIPIDWGTA